MASSNAPKYALTDSDALALSAALTTLEAIKDRDYFHRVGGEASAAIDSIRSMLMTLKVIGEDARASFVLGTEPDPTPEPEPETPPNVYSTEHDGRPLIGTYIFTNEDTVFYRDSAGATRSAPVDCVDVART